jgi:acyl-[acyl-carrier-protein]-phospholipid O-acyltransferase/long-chain-fatty-acid--[acyl-carrier-protein] ligase
MAEHELVGANALIEGGTFLAILLGTIAGGLLILTAEGVALVSGLLVSVALLGALASFLIPRAGPAAPDLKVNWNVMAETLAIVAHAGRNRPVWLSILGISWFWLLGFTYLSQFTTYAKDTLGADEHVVTLFLTVFSVGIAIGSVLCTRALAGEVSARYVPLGALAMTAFGIDLYVASGHGAGAETEALLGIWGFLATAANWRIVADLLGMAIAGGFFIVPLYAILQARSSEAHRARNIAANNIVNALFMVAGSVATGLLLWSGASITDIFLAVAIANAGVALYICKLLPDEVVKAMARLVFRRLYRVEVRGLENYAKAGDRVLIVANHTSFLDGPLICAFLPKTPTFAINSLVAARWWVRPAFAMFDLLPLDPTNPLAAKTMVKAVKDGRHCLIFPEGRITVTGALMKVYDGPGTIADLADAEVLPIRIDGAQYTAFSRLRGKVRLRWFPKIVMTILPPRRLEVPAEIKGRRRRRLLADQLYSIMAGMMFETADLERTLFQALVEARAVHGPRHVVLEDVERNPLDYARLILGCLVLGQRLKAISRPGERLALLLPNAVGTAVTFFALQACGRVPAMLNFTSGAAAMLSACATAKVKTVLTSRRFVELGRLDAVVAELSKGAEVVYLEDLRQRITAFDKLFGLVVRPFAGRLAGHLSGGANADDPAVVLFTSGSEGAPKGVVLSHRNLQANRHQLSSVVDFSPTDKVFNALPLFHSFGLTGGLLLPLLSGVRIFLYPSPLHYRIVPELVYDTNATLLFGTDTFLSGYARSANPYDFYSLRYVFAGAEKVKDETRRVWAERFGVRVFEGYGATETAPVLATNTAMHYRAGTVGRLLPGIEYRLDPVPGIETGGRLVVRGPNVMLGYLLADKPGLLQPPPDGWYDTGDIVEIDDDGYLRIAGRAKRFAKIAGEMVSLGAVEGHVSALWPGEQHAVVSLPDPRRGEQLVLVTERRDAARGELQTYMQNAGAAELMVPRTIVPVEKMPLLATGKLDYVSIQKLAEAEVVSAAAG